ncbi:MAG: hypothetical protein AAGF57_01295 [Pseudomonadota bacterium]
MSTNTQSSDRVREAVDTLILTEVFLMQAAVESVTAIGDGVSSLGRKMVTSEGAVYPEDSIKGALQHIADEALEPYRSRFQHLKRLRNSAE